MTEAPETQKSLGALEQGVKTLLENDAVARENRREIYVLLSGMNTRLTVVEGDVKRTMPLVEKHEQAHNRRMGAYTLAGAIGSAGALALTFLKDKIMGLVS